jgi:hypothetical protein
MAELKKPDMRAVLDRTRLTANIQGLMLPIFEAGSNSIHAIGERTGGSKVSAEGTLQFRFVKGTSPADLTVTITDNGVGLDDSNWDAFITPFTGHKLRKNGKGFGRFVAFKVFNKVEYHSRSESGLRSFVFDVYDTDEEIKELPDLGKAPDGQGSTVMYKGAKHEYKAAWSQLSKKSALDLLTENFLTYLVDGSMPRTEVVFDDEATDLRSHFTQVFSHEETHEFNLTIEGEDYPFTCRVSRVTRGSPFRRHALLFYADNRLVGRGRAIEDKLGKSVFQHADGSDYVIIASVSSPFLDENASQDRTFLVADEEVIKQIVDECCQRILSTEREQNDRIKGEQRGQVVDLLKSYPLLRFGLSGKTIEQYVLSRPNNWNKERFVSDLAVQRLREERRWQDYVHETVADKELFEQRKDNLLKRVSTTYRDALSEYVVHRKAVIEVAEQLRRFDDSQAMAPEDAMHQLVFPRNTDSVQTKYYQHNLWLLDERLAFVSYASSDRTFHGGRRKAGDKISDVNFYDEVFVAGGQGTSSVLVVEFKRPGRDDYAIGRRGCDPIKQIKDTVKLLREEKRFVTSDGASISVPTNTPITAFVVADLEPSLVSLASEYDFTESWDRKYYFNYHDAYDVYMEIYGYDKLLEDAKKRNSPFFDVLLSDLGN